MFDHLNLSSTFIGCFHPLFPSSKTVQNQGKNGMFLGLNSTGKELDEETGYGYFGARYMDHELMTGWLSVDPMAEKYPNISPYAYCAWNPLKLIDHTGREFETIIDHNNRTITIRATFTSYSDNKKEQKIIDQAVNNWNSSSFALSLKDENGQAVDYTVNFDINNGHGPNNSVSFIPDELFDQKYSKHSTAGGVSDGQNIIVKSSVAYSNAQILAHEMGHCIGLIDDFSNEQGLMFASNTNNYSIKHLSESSRMNLLVACGLNFGPFQSVKGRKQCSNTVVYGEAPLSFNKRLRASNLTTNNTQFFTK